MFGVGVIRGASIFVLVDQTAAQYARPAMVLLFILAGVVCVCAGVLILRYKNSHLPRPFKTPGVPAVPILGILS